MSIRYGGQFDVSPLYQVTGEGGGEGDPSGCAGPPQVSCGPGYRARCRQGQWWCEATGGEEQSEADRCADYEEQKRAECQSQGARTIGTGCDTKCDTSVTKDPKTGTPHCAEGWTYNKKTRKCDPPAEDTEEEEETTTKPPPPPPPPTTTTSSRDDIPRSAIIPRDEYGGAAPQVTPEAAVKLPPIFEPQTEIYDPFKACLLYTSPSPRDS